MNIRHATRMLFRHRTLSPQTCRMISVKTTPPRETSANSFGHHSLADNSGRLAANLEEVRGELLERNIGSSSLANRLEHELFNEYYVRSTQSTSTAAKPDMSLLSWGSKPRPPFEDCETNISVSRGSSRIVFWNSWNQNSRNIETC